MAHFLAAKGTSDAPLSANTGAVVALQRVTKQFGSRAAITDLTLDLSPGLVGLLGPNGAGKTTLLHVMAGLTVPTSGQVQWLGRYGRRDPGLDHAIALAGDGDQLPRRETPLQYLTLLLQTSGYGALQAQDRAAKLLSRLGLQTQQHQAMSGLSRGQRQRVKIAQAFAIPAKLLLLDEPLNALDPVWRLEVAALMHDAAQSGACVVVSSHILQEVEQLATWLVLLFKGRLVAAGTRTDIATRLRSQATVLKLRTDQPTELARELLRLAPITTLRLLPDGLQVQASDVDALCLALPNAVVNTGAQVFELDGEGDDLVSLFTTLSTQVR
jgi:ABC-2 type transport system ATP-binding protein